MSLKQPLGCGSTESVGDSDIRYYLRLLVLSNQLCKCFYVLFVK